MKLRLFFTIPALVLGVSVTAGAQTTTGPLAGSVTTVAATEEPMPLTLDMAVERGLKYNLSLISIEDQVESARGSRMRSLRGLLPHIEARAGEVRQTVNLAAFGFSGALFPGVSTIVGPFDVFDARLYGSQPLLDLGARNDVRSKTAAFNAARFDSQNARDTVTFVVTSLYFQAVSGESRIQTARSQVATAEALFTLATNLRNAGAAPGIDVVRAQVQLQAARQRLIAAENDFAKQTLQLARAIGLPTAQRVALSDRNATVAGQSLTLDEALTRAASGRADYQASLERVHAAEAALNSTRSETLPSLRLNVDYGAIGPTPREARRTYSISANVRVPLYDPDREGKQVENAATLRQRQAEAADLVQKIEAEVRTAFLDVQATEQQLAVARERVALANQELQLARTRFSAGVTSNLEVIQAQNEVATATDIEVSGVYAFNVAQAALARAIGAPETAKP
jgi:outer membrane protein TolC